jgi:low affinity Fe/Cu permease
MSGGIDAGVAVKHPTERGRAGRTRFDRAAEAASNFSSSPMFFTVCGLLVAAWAAAYLLTASDTLHHLLADSVAALTLLLVALLGLHDEV